MTGATPAAQVAGIDRWREGWMVAVGPAASGPDPRFAHVSLVAAATVGEVLDLVGRATVAIDMPIALARTGRRSAEVELRSALGAASRSVFTSPTRSAIEAATREAAEVINRAAGGPGISVQSWGLVKSIREVRESLAATSHASCWFETHPETAFALMNQGEPMASKRSARGVGQRITALAERGVCVAEVLSSAPAKVPVDDVLDSLAALWSASRIVSSNARAFGPVGCDDDGFETSIRV